MDNLNKNPQTNETIFIQIASYRDEELSKTIDSCLKQAKFPERLSFGIVNQYGDETEHSLDAYKNDKRFRITEMPWRESKGVGFARHICNSLYKDETFSFHIDSHMRFDKNWDEFVIDQWKKCKSEKAILTGYPASYKYDEHDKEVYSKVNPSRVIFHRFCNKYVPIFIGKVLQPPPAAPFRGSFISGGFLFSIGKVCQEIPYSADICFIGEEIVHSIRLFTHGYRIFHPTKWVVYHLYVRSKNQKNSHHFWNDFRNDPELAREKVYEKMNVLSDRTIKKVLLEGDSSLLGTQNTLDDFENYVGVKIKEKIIHPDQLAGKEPPFATDDSWVDTVAPHRAFNISLQIPVEDFDMTIKDYDFWYFGLHDEDELELTRDDIRLDDWGVKNIPIDKQYFLRKDPKKYIIWPHSKSQGWLQRKVYSL